MRAMPLGMCLSLGGAFTTTAAAPLKCPKCDYAKIPSCFEKCPVGKYTQQLALKVNQFSLRVVVFGMSSYMARPKKNVKYEIVRTNTHTLRAL